MKVSIIICTRNRAESLQQTLEAIGQVNVATDLPTELLIVDNASTDNTGHVVATCRLSNLPVRYIHEPRKGKGYAYNTGMFHAEGEIFLFTDDDVRPPENWIEEMCGPILRGEADAVGGAVRLAPHLERPWLKGDLRGWVACTDVIDLHCPGCVAGANMTFSRRVLEKVPAFDPELGPGASGFFDEALFWRQLVRAGFRTIGRPDVVVEHHFDETRLQQGAFLEMARGMGRSWSYVHYHWEHGHIRFAAPKLWLFRVRNRLGKFASLFSKSTNKAPRLDELYVAFQLSLIEEYCRLQKCGVRNYAKMGLVKRGRDDAQPEPSKKEGCSSIVSGSSACE